MSGVSEVGRVGALVQLTHPLPSLATVAAALGFAGLASNGWLPPGLVFQLGGALLAQQLATSLHNDWCDRDIDALAKPDRAIPSGAIKPATVLWLAAALSTLSLALALPFGMDEVALVGLWLVTAVAYNAWLKRTVWSWLPFCIGFPLIALYGAAALDHWPGWIWWACLLAQPLIIAIHLADSLPDLEADAAAGSHGLAWHLGARRARTACGAGFVASGVLLAVLAFAARG